MRAPRLGSVCDAPFCFNFVGLFGSPSSIFERANRLNPRLAPQQNSSALNTLPDEAQHVLIGTQSGILLGNRSLPPCTNLDFVGTHRGSLHDKALLRSQLGSRTLGRFSFGEYKLE